MDATWRSGPRGSAHGRARAPAWRGGDKWTHYLYLTYIVFNNMYRSSEYRTTFYQPSFSAHVIYPTDSINFLSVGLFSSFRLIAGRVAAFRASDEDRVEYVV